MAKKHTLLLATHNRGKAEELSQLLRPLGWEVLVPSQVPAVASLDVVEDAQTLAANATKKAIAFGQAAHVLTVADDTGLEVTALHGEPGVHAKRYGPTAEARNQRLLSELAAEGNPDRSARFVTALCLFEATTGQTKLFEGQVTGQIATEIAEQDVTEGLGYDTVFIPDLPDQPANQLTFAELGPAIKQQVSHRRRALDALRVYLEEHYA